MDNQAEKKAFIQIELFYGNQSQGSYTQPFDETVGVDDLIPDGLEGLGVGDSYRLTKVLLTQEEYDALPEFVGF